MSRKSSYQKLKEQNQELRQDIFNLLRKVKFSDYINTSTKWNMIFDFEDIVWNSSTKKTNNNE